MGTPHVGQEGVVAGDGLAGATGLGLVEEECAGLTGAGAGGAASGERVFLSNAVNSAAL